MNMTQAMAHIEPVDKNVIEKATSRFHQIAMPLNSLGGLQQMVIDICGASNHIDPDITKRAVVVFCADNGVVTEGVTQTDSHITAVVAHNLTTHTTAMCKMASYTHTHVIPVNIGIKEEIKHPKILYHLVANGTKNMAKEPAMTREEAILSIEVGINIAIELYHKGYRLLATGEMGIGNTTTASAMASVLLNRPVAEMTGQGAGLSKEGVARKVQVIEKALALHAPQPTDVIGVLSAVGGLDIGGMIGLMFGCAVCKIPCVVDGFISSVSALCAVALCPEVRGYLLPSHQSAEPAGRALLEALDMKPLITAGMRLGEGSGAVAVLPLMDMAMKIYREMITFAQMEMEAYKPL